MVAGLKVAVAGRQRDLRQAGAGLFVGSFAAAGSVAAAATGGAGRTSRAAAGVVVGGATATAAAAPGVADVAGQGKASGRRRVARCDSGIDPP